MSATNPLGPVAPVASCVPRIGGSLCPPAVKPTCNATVDIYQPPYLANAAGFACAVLANNSASLISCCGTTKTETYTSPDAWGGCSFTYCNVSTSEAQANVQACLSTKVKGTCFTSYVAVPTAGETSKTKEGMAGRKQVGFGGVMVVGLVVGILFGL
ncbi:hypothetical protein B0O99DRAFT_721532 [Bisporella sp. PMI_857]|nr:hypothetical protein B0O99DRAFT_721532 [Bisporella sp. PMI_857]